jgi:hypothetical protein
MYFNRTLNNTRHLDVDLVSGTIFSDWESELVRLGASNSQLDVNIGTTINSIGTSIQNANNYSGQLGITVNNTINNLNSYESVNGTSISNLQVTNQFLQNEIDNLVLTSVSQGVLDYLYGISIANDDAKISVAIGSSLVPYGTSLYNQEIHKMDKNICSVSFNNADLYYSSLGVTINSLGVSLTNFDSRLGVSLSNLQTEDAFLYNEIVLLSTSTNDNTDNLNTISSFLQGEINGLAVTTANTQSTLDTLKTAYDITAGVLGALDVAYTAFAAAQTLYNTLQSSNNFTQQTELDGLQGQIDSIDTRIDTIEEQLGTSFTNTNTHFGVLEQFKSIMLSTTVPHLDNLISIVSVSGGNLESNKADRNLFGSSISQNTNRIDNIIGVSLFNVDVWKGNMIGTTIPNIQIIGVSVSNLESHKLDLIQAGITIASIGTSYTGIVSMGVSHKNLITDLGTSSTNLESHKLDLIQAGITIASIGTSFSGVQNMGVSHINLITTLGSSSSSLESHKLDTLLAGITIASIGTSYTGVVNMGISHKNLITDLGTSSSNLESHKLDLIQAGITIASIGTSYTGIVSMGVSHKNLITDLGASSSSLESNKINTSLIGITLNSISVSYSGSQAFGVSSSNLITALSVTTSNLESHKLDTLLAGITIASIGTSYSGVVSLGITHKNLITDLGTSSGNQESNKADKLLLSSSYTGTVNQGVSFLNLINALSVSSGNTPAFGVSINSVDIKVGTLVGISTPGYLQRNENVLPNSFITIGTTASNRNLLTDEYLIHQSNNANCFTQYRSTNGKIGALVGNVNGDLLLRCSNDSTKKSIIQNSGGTQLTTWANNGLLLHEYDLTISGVLQSPLTSLIGVSYTGIVSMGISHGNLTSTLGVSCGLLESNKMDKLLVSTSYTGVITTGISHQNMISDLGVSSGALETRKMDKALVGVSISNIDSALRTGTIGDTWGSTGTSKIIGTNNDVTLNSSGANCFFQFRGSTRASNDLFGALSDDLLIRATEGKILFQKSGGTQIAQMTQNLNMSIGNINDTYKLDVSGDINISSGSVFRINGTSVLSSSTLGSGIVNSSLTSIGILNNGTDPLGIVNSGGNVNFKQTASSKVRRWETQTGGDYYLWDENNNQILKIANDKQCWWVADVNTTGGFYSNGIPITSSKRLKREINKIKDNNLFYQLQFKQYEKIIGEEFRFEYGVIADDVKELDPDNTYRLWETKKGDDGQELDYVHYIKIFSLGMNEIQKLRKEIDELKQKK